MAEDAKEREKMAWLREPPAPGEAHIYIKIGEGAELTPEVRQALDALIRALPESEVEGYARPTCNPEVICGRISTGPCCQLPNTLSVCPRQKW